MGPINERSYVYLGAASTVASSNEPSYNEAKDKKDDADNNNGCGWQGYPRSKHSGLITVRLVYFSVSGFQWTIETVVKLNCLTHRTPPSLYLNHG